MPGFPQAGGSLQGRRGWRTGKRRARQQDTDAASAHLHRGRGCRVRDSYSLHPPGCAHTCRGVEAGGYPASDYALLRDEGRSRAADRVSPSGRRDGGRAGGADDRADAGAGNAHSRGHDRPAGPQRLAQHARGAMAALEELEETARLWLLTARKPEPLTAEQINQLRQHFGASW